jgi:hypothetical protein
MVKALKKSMWTCSFFVLNVFPLSNVHQIIFIFLSTLIYSIKGDPCVQNIHKIKIYIPI